jgi:hypothetical protein
MSLVRVSLVVALLWPAVAAAAPRRQTAVPAPQRFDFDEDVVEGGRNLPQVEIVSSTTKGRKESLLRLRTTFVPELLDSARRE